MRYNFNHCVNCVVEINDRLTPLKSALLDFESNERLLYIPAS